MKIWIFERDNSLRQLLQLVCQQVSREVEVAESPDLCPAYNFATSDCGCSLTCDDILIVDAHLQPISGLDWLEAQVLGQCHVPSAHKLILATNWSPREIARAERLGCTVMRKPFSAHELRAWLQQRLKR